MREIIRLRRQQEEEEEALRSERKPTLLAELRALRLRKADLERHLSSLQESRRDLVLQLEVLMRMLKVVAVFFHLYFIKEQNFEFY